MLPVLRIRGILPNGGTKMRRWLYAVATLLTVAPAVTRADPEWFLVGPIHHPTSVVILYWPGYYIWPAGTVFQPEVVSADYTHWYKQQLPIVTPKLEYRVEKKKVKTYALVPKEVDEPTPTLTYEPVQRLVEKEVVTTVILPLLIMDPAGHPLVVCRVENKAHKLRYPVTDYRLVPKEYTLKVTKIVPEERETEVTSVVPVVRYDQSLSTEWRAMQVPCQKVVTVPTIDLHHMPPNFFP
jgi:hypothetical protein